MLGNDKSVLFLEGHLSEERGAKHYFQKPLQLHFMFLNECNREKLQIFCCQSKFQDYRRIPASEKCFDQERKHRAPWSDAETKNKTIEMVISNILLLLCIIMNVVIFIIIISIIIITSITYNNCRHHNHHLRRRHHDLRHQRRNFLS